MAAPALYWRIYLRDQQTQNSATRIPLKRLTVHTADGTNVTASATVTTDFGLGAGTLALLNDGDDNTVAELQWNTTSSNYRYIQYQFASPTLLDYFAIRTGTAVTSGGTRALMPYIDFIIQSSDNGTTWFTQAVLGRPFLLDDVVYQGAMDVDSTYYPLPIRTQLGGAGGIYGIVSEDGVALPNRPVYLYERDGFQKIGNTTTDENGGYAFNGLSTTREFMVLSVDPSGPPYKNALIWDRITPINTLGSITPQSPFWARRLRDPACGASFSVTQILDGATYNYFESSIGSGTRSINNYSFLDGATIDTIPNGNGLYAFLKSNRTPTYNGVGPFFELGGGLYGVNAAGNTLNYAALSFEYIFVPPTAGESDLLMIFPGYRDDNDGYGTNSSSRVPGGPTLQVTTSAINVRMPLGGRNLSTIRATAPVTQGQIHHVVVTYLQDTTIKLYVNGVLVQTASISGAGRLWVFDKGTNEDYTSWDSWYGQVNQAVRRVSSAHIGGAGGTAVGGVYGIAAWGGRFGHMGLFGRVLSDSDVAALYDSFVNPTTHTVLTTQSGYAGEVEADNPTYYERCNQLAIPGNTAAASWPIVGRKDQYAVHRTGNVYGATGFVSGNTAINFDNSGNTAGLLLTSHLTNTTFTMECFVRPASLANSYNTIFQTRWTNANEVIAVYLRSSGLIELRIADQSNTLTTFAFSHTALVVGTNYHIAVTYEPWTAKQAKLYINGVNVSTQTAGTLPANGNAAYTSIGINQSGTGTTYSDWFRGVIGEFAFYNYALSAARIQAHYDARNS